MKYIAFLRGINVGGKHKVPMPELKQILESLDCKEVKTLLNSGNVVFESQAKKLTQLEEKLKEHFGFPIPVLLKKHDEILALIASQPFEKVAIHPNIRLYVTFIKEKKPSIQIQEKSIESEGFKIILLEKDLCLSVLDLNFKGSTKAMERLDKTFGKNITTRNWNTILKLAHL